MTAFPSNDVVKEGYPLKCSYFTAIGSCSVKLLQIDTVHLTLNVIEPPK